MQRISRITGQDLPARRRAIAWMAPILVAAAAVTTFAAFRPATACPPDKEAEAAELTMRAHAEELAARDVRIVQVAQQQQRRAQDADVRAAQIAELEAAREQMRKRLAELEARLEAMRNDREATRADRKYDEWRRARAAEDLSVAESHAREAARAAELHARELLESRRAAEQARKAEGQARYDEERARYEGQWRQQIEAERRSVEEARANERERWHAEHEAERRRAEEDRMRYLEHRRKELEADRRREGDLRARDYTESEARRAEEEAARVDAENRYRAEMLRARAQVEALQAQKRALEDGVRAIESPRFDWNEARERARYLEEEAARLRDRTEVQRQHLRDDESIRHADLQERARDAEMRIAEARRRLDELASREAVSETKAADMLAALEDAKAKLAQLSAENAQGDDAAQQRATDRVKQLLDEAARHRAEADSVSNAYEAMRQQYEEQMARQRESQGNRGSCDAASGILAQRALAARAAAEAQAAAMAAREKAKVRQEQIRMLEQSIRQADPTQRGNEVTIQQVLDQAAKRVHEQDPKLDAEVREQLLERIEQTRWRLEHSRQVEKQKAAEIEALRQRLDKEREQVEKAKHEKEKSKKEEAKPKRRELHVLATPEAEVEAAPDAKGEGVATLPVGLDAYLQQLRLDKASEETAGGGMSF